MSSEQPAPLAKQTKLNNRARRRPRPKAARHGAHGASASASRCPYTLELFDPKRCPYTVDMFCP